MELFDTHTHLDDEQFGGAVRDVIERACQAGVTAILTVGTTRASSEAAVSIARAHPRSVWAAVGIQPNYGQAASSEDWDGIVALARAPQVRAIGETGLDAYWDFTPLEVQQRLFAAHLQLAQTLDLPVIVHMRDCELLTLGMLREAAARGPLRGVMHSFSGTPDLAQQCLTLGFHVSFAGMVTFKKSDALRAIARTIPDDRLLLETDAPYLTPHPHRGRRPNEPALLVHTAECVARVRRVPLATLAATTRDNARQLFLGQ